MTNQKASINTKSAKSSSSDPLRQCMFPSVLFSCNKVSSSRRVGRKYLRPLSFLRTSATYWFEKWKVVLLLLQLEFFRRFLYIRRVTSEKTVTVATKKHLSTLLENLIHFPNRNSVKKKCSSIVHILFVAREIVETMNEIFLTLWIFNNFIGMLICNHGQEHLNFILSSSSSKLNLDRKSISIAFCIFRNLTHNTMIRFISPVHMFHC